MNFKYSRIRTVYNILIGISSIVMMGCTSQSERHIAVGSWLAQHHDLRVYVDGTAAFDGTAVSWERLSDTSIKLTLSSNNVSKIWEFRVKGRRRLAANDTGRVTANPGGRDSAAVSGRYQPQPVPDWAIEQAKSAPKRAGVLFLIMMARQNGEELGTLYAGVERIDFIREPGSRR